jgi:hypothetical protein
MSAYGGGAPESPNTAVAPETDVGSGDDTAGSPSDATLSGSSILPTDDAVRERPVSQSSKPTSRTIDPSKLQPSDFFFGKCLGEGAYARVVHARAKNTDAQFAVKIMEKRHIKKENKVRPVLRDSEVEWNLHASVFLFLQIKYVMTERNILSRSNHPFIIK